MSRRLCILSLDAPYPVTSGGRADVYWRLLALQSPDLSLQLHYWSAAPSAESDRAHLRSLASEVHEYRLPPAGVASPARILAKLNPFYPAYCAATAPRGRERASFIARVREFAPDAVLVEGMQSWGAASALRASLPKKTRFIYRSQNNETEYHRNMAKAARGMRRLSLAYEALKLRFFEPKALRRSDTVLHISEQEAAFWKTRGLANQLWVPPVFTPAAAGAEPAPGSYDVLWLGSLFATHKREGLLWFLRDVAPRLTGSLRCAVAGSHAPPEIAAACREAGVHFLGEVKDAFSTMLHSRVLVNPVHRASGVNMKMLEMIAARRPVVCTSAGVTGLPAEVRSVVRISDTPEGFAESIFQSLRDGPASESSIERFLEQFSPRRYCQTISAFL